MSARILQFHRAARPKPVKVPSQDGVTVQFNQIEHARVTALICEMAEQCRDALRALGEPKRPQYRGRQLDEASESWRREQTHRFFHMRETIVRHINKLAKLKPGEPMHFDWLMLRIIKEFSDRAKAA